MAYKQAYLKIPLNFKLFPGNKIKKSAYPTDFQDPRLGMSLDQFNAKSRKKEDKFTKTN